MAQSPYRFTVVDTYEIVDPPEEDARASFDDPGAIFVMTGDGVRVARLVKRVVDMRGQNGGQ